LLILHRTELLELSQQVQTFGKQTDLYWIFVLDLLAKLFQQRKKQNFLWSIWWPWGSVSRRPQVVWWSSLSTYELSFLNCGMLLKLLYVATLLKQSLKLHLSFSKALINLFWSFNWSVEGCFSRMIFWFSYHECTSQLFSSSRVFHFVICRMLMLTMMKE